MRSLKKAWQSAAVPVALASALVVAALSAVPAMAEDTIAEDMEDLFAEPELPSASAMRERVGNAGLLGALKARTSAAVAAVLADNLNADALASLVPSQTQVGESQAQMRTTRTRDVAAKPSTATAVLSAGMAAEAPELSTAAYEHRRVDAGVSVARNERGALATAVIGAISACHARAVGVGAALAGDVRVQVLPVADIRIHTSQDDAVTRRFATCLQGSLARVVTAQPPTEPLELRATLAVSLAAGNER